MKTISVIIILTNIIYINAIINNTSLKQIHVIFRHGERFPTDTYKNDPYKNLWADKWGELTNKGKQQMYILGKILRETYSNFIPDYYFKNETQILSSYSDRCLMSMELLLAGLFPPKGQQIWNKNLLWQPIPIKYNPRNKDNLIAMKQKCKIYDSALIEAFNSEKNQIINKNNENLYNYLTQHTGNVVNNISTVEFLFNTLEIELLQNLTLPEWTKSVSFLDLKNLAAQALATYTDNKLMKRLKGGVFLKKTINSMKNYINNSIEPKILLYSGHDITLVNILRTLNIVDVIKPDYGAILIIELHKDLNFVVKMIYKNGIYEDFKDLTLPKCTSPCPFKKFVELLSDSFPINWDEECQN